MCLGTYQVSSLGRSRLTEAEMKADLITRNHLHTTNPYTMNHIQVQRVMCGKVGQDQVIEMIQGIERWTI